MNPVPGKKVLFEFNRIKAQKLVIKFIRSDLIISILR